MEFPEGSGTTLHYSLSNIGNEDVASVDFTVSVVDAVTGDSIASFARPNGVAQGFDLS